MSEVFSEVQHRVDVDPHNFVGSVGWEVFDVCVIREHDAIDLFL
jgi:hypothetical protein